MTPSGGTRERLVVVGAGMAATRLVERLVAGGYAGQVTVLGDEACAPYNRILLSAVLEGSHRSDTLTLRDPDWFAAHGVDLRLGSRVVGLDRDRRVVALLDGEEIAYDRLVWATGALATLPPIRGLVAEDGQLDPRVHAFRRLVDCQRLLKAVAELPAVLPVDGDPVTTAKGHAVVVGGGLLGLQVARALAVRGLAVEVIEGTGHLLAGHVNAAAGSVLARDLRRLGSDVHTGVRAVRLTDAGVRLDNGVVLPTDLVVLTAGARPAVGVVRAAGLVVGRGVVVDDRLTTSDPRIHAIGDCAEHRGRTTGFVPPAWEQAEVLAALLFGNDAAYDGARTVARLRATDLEVAVLGDPERASGEVVEVTNPVRGTYRKLVVDGGVITAAALVGDLGRVGLVTQHFDRRTVLGEAEPGELLMPDPDAEPTVLPDDVEVCACAGVTAGEVRACSSYEHCRESTRATTGCGGCAGLVRTLLAETPARVIRAEPSDAPTV